MNRTKAITTVLVLVMTSMTTFLSADDIAKEGGKKTAPPSDMLTPRYYLPADNNAFRIEVDRFIAAARKEPFHQPLRNAAGKSPRFSMRRMGKFGAGKGPGGNKSHHAAVDFHVGNRETNVAMYAAHDGRVSTVRDAPKYRQYLAITKNVAAENGDILGKIVTLYAHLDLDQDEAAGLAMNGKKVRKGDLVSKHLYSGTRGGPHLHFEVRYYRPHDKGTETFYGFRFPGQPTDLTHESVEPWSYGYWNLKVGYGFADPRNHGVICY